MSKTTTVGDVAAANMEMLNKLTRCEKNMKQQPSWMERLEELFRVFSTISENSYIFLCDLEHDYSVWSRNAVETFNLPGTHMTNAGSIWAERIHPDDRATYQKSIDMIFSGALNYHDIQYRAQERYGRYDMCTCRGLVLRDDDGKPKYFGGSIKNHTLENRIDSLTGLMNRAGFFEALKALIRNREDAVIVMFGLSEFSEVNSIYGYDFGNRVIRKAARHFASELGTYGDYFRLDGTQTILISHNASVPFLKEKYAELKEWLLDELEVEGHHIPLRLNGALMELNEFDIDDNTVFVCLNASFQKSKRASQGELVVFQDHDRENPQDALRRMNEIRLSQSRNFEGFQLFYQPIVNAKTEELLGAEALLRWQNEEFGFVPPDVFMPVLEHDARFYTLGIWIMQRAMHDGLAMVRKIPKFMLHVNITYTQIQNPSFAHDVIWLLEETGYPKENFCLELTERCRLADQSILKQTMAQLKAYGIKFALDDFGTGYSSANLLNELDIDVIKIDKSFIRDIETNERARKALNSFVELANIYGAETCVEGIETAGMREGVLTTAANTLQGYYYARPIPYDEFCKRYDM